MSGMAPLYWRRSSWITFKDINELSKSWQCQSDCVDNSPWGGSSPSSGCHFATCDPAAQDRRTFKQENFFFSPQFLLTVCLPWRAGPPLCWDFAQASLTFEGSLCLFSEGRSPGQKSFLEIHWWQGGDIKELLEMDTESTRAFLDGCSKLCENVTNVAIFPGGFPEYRFQLFVCHFCLWRYIWKPRFSVKSLHLFNLECSYIQFLMQGWLGIR